MHLDVAFSTLFHLLTTPHLVMLMAVAVPMGIFFGSTPGLGGKLGLVLLIPFVYNMDQLTGAVFLCAMHAVVHTGGSIPSILIGVPGDGPAAATALDGYAMTKKGQAGRALGASFGASTIGGLLGAVFLGLSLPILEPVILSFSPAEFFLLAILGITFIATLSGKSFLKGMIVGLFGLMCAFIGLDPSTGSPRFAFGQLWLWDGLSVIVAVLAMFAVPEMISLGVKGRAFDISPEAAAALQKSGTDLPAATGSQKVSYAEIWRGIWDVLQHKWLVLRCSLLVAGIGIIPGLGGDAASWMAYGHTVQSSKHPERFGKGEVAGVIGAETGSCAKEAGSLLPTLFFGVPGSSGMAIMLGAFLMLGIQPGPTMLTDHIDIVWSLIWALVISNVICAIMLVAAAPWIGKLGSAKASFLIPYVLVFALLGCYLFQGNWQNLILVLVMGSLGYLFKRHDWPRAPFIIGVILGKIAEDSLLKAIGIWGPSFFWRPISLVLIGLIVASIGFYIWRMRKPAAVPSHA
ncbi:MAG TPA: tripartite tricarboxylate transporter permease [Micropepsaceae bacterium]|nr:tripartite tricarboxylate transporter permease [Micropepsaceae bacterium]